MLFESQLALIRELLFRLAVNEFNFVNKKHANQSELASL